MAYNENDDGGMNYIKKLHRMHTKDTRNANNYDWMKILWDGCWWIDELNVFFLMTKTTMIKIRSTRYTD